jgi:hypothetical protein
VRNIKDVDVQPISGLNALCVLLPDRLLTTPAALDSLRERSKK